MRVGFYLVREQAPADGGIDLRAERINRGHSIASLAAELKLSEATIKRAESGQRPHPRNAFKIASYFHRKVTECWPLEDDPSVPTSIERGRFRRVQDTPGESEQAA